MKPLAIELFCGCFGGTDGWMKAGGYAVGFDLQHEHYHGKVPAGAELVLQDVLTLHGSQFKDAAFIWASPPCQKYSWLAMPWSRSTDPENSKAAKALRKKWETEGPDNRLFDTPFRIQREALIATGYICETCGAPDEPRIEMTAPAGHQHSDDLAEYAPCSECLNKSKRYIPLIVENVRGAVPWVGKQQAQFGSFYLWGDVAQIGNRVVAGRDLADIRAGRGRFGMGVAPERGNLKGHGSTWFGIQSNGDTYDQRNVNPVSGANKVPGFRFDGSGRSFQTASVEAHGIKVPGQIRGKEYAMCRTGAAGQKTLGHVNKRDGHGHTRHLTNQAESDAVREAKSGKAAGGWFNDYKKDGEGCVGISRTGSKSNARKAASAMIAKIPLALSRYIAEQHMDLHTL